MYATPSDATVYPSAHTLASDTSTSIRHVRRALKELRRQGLIHRGGVKGKRGRQTYTYRLDYEAMRKRAKYNPS